MTRIATDNSVMTKTKTVYLPVLRIQRAALAAAFWMLVLALAVGCNSNIDEVPVETGKNQPGSYTATDDISQAGGNSSSLFDVSIGPPNATKASIIQLDADRSKLYGGNVNWYVNGLLVEHNGGTRLSYKDISRGDVIKAVIVKDDGEEISSNELVIKNSPPTIQQAEVQPKFPMVGNTPKVKVWGSDIDGDKVTFEYQWYVNGKPDGRWSVLEAEFKKSDKIKVKITPHDGLEYGKSVTLTPIITNAPPVINTHRGRYDGSVYRSQLMADDPDNDTLFFELIEAPEGMKIDSGSGLITWRVILEAEKTYPIKARVSDGNGGSSVYAFKLTTHLEK